MKSYLLLVKGSFAAWNSLSEIARDEAKAKFGVFARELGAQGYLQGGDGCGERSFRFTANDLTPAAALLPNTTKDMVTGFFMLEVPNEEIAIGIAKKCPAFEYGEYTELVPCGE